MPLLGAFVIAGDRFKEKKPSFNLYNISSGINTSDLSSWFTRWMLAQELEVSRSVVYWEVIRKSRKWWPYHVIAGAISFFLIGFLIAMTVLSKDWYGFANAIAMAISIVLRAYILQANRNAINKAVLNAQPVPGTFKYALKVWNSDKRGPEPDESARPDGTHWKSEQAKVMIVMSDAKAVTMFIPEQLVIPVFVNNPQPCNEWLYALFRWVGWTAFAVHIISIGLAKLATQMYTVALLIIPTVLICWKVGCDDSKWYRRLQRTSNTDMETPYECWIGSHLKATMFEWPKGVEFERSGDGVWQRQDPEGVRIRSNRRQDLYAWLNLTAEEEDSMGKWDLLPHKRNDDNTWENDYNAKKELIRTNPIDIRVTKDAITEDIERYGHGIRLCGRRRRGSDAELSSRSAAQSGDPLEPRAIQRASTTISTSGLTIQPTSVPSTAVRPQVNGPTRE